MAPPKLKNHIIIALATIVMLSTCSEVGCKNAACSVDKYDSDKYHMGLLYVLDQLTTDTISNGYDYYVVSPGPPVYDLVYAHGACNGELTDGECTSCLYDAAGGLVDYCYMSVGAQVQFPDCRVRYESYPFQE